MALLEQTMDNISSLLHYDSEQLIRELGNKEADPRTAERARYWKPKAARALELTENFSMIIDHSCMEIANDVENGEKIVRAVQINFTIFLDDMEKLDPRLAYHNAAFVEKLRHYTGTEKSDYSSLFTKNNSSSELITLLKKLKTDAETLLRQTLVKCNENSFAVTCGLRNSYPIQMQNTTRLTTGEIFTLTAGIGSFSIGDAPKISIEGKPIELDEAGVAKLSFRAGKPGHYKLPIRYDWASYEGSRISYEDTIEYTVLEK
jgi:hypothetical protein